jgi:ribosomal protein S27E
MNTKPSKATQVFRSKFPNPTCRTCEHNAVENGTKVECIGCPNVVLQQVPEVLNYSQTKRAALAFLGCHACVWTTDNTVEVGLELNPGRKILGSGVPHGQRGDAFQEALEAAVLAVVKAGN